MTDQVRNSPACSEPPSRPTMCVQGCGFFGNPRTENMCSVCHRKATSATVITASNSSSTSVANNSSNLSSPASTPPITSNPASPSSIPAIPPISIRATSLGTTLNAQGLSPLTPIQRAPAPSPFSMSLADPLPDSLSVSFLEPFTEPTATGTNTTSIQLEALPSSFEAPIAIATIPYPEQLTIPTSLTSSPAKQMRNRCKVCSRKVGIAYFNCKCDDDAKFCSSHRYPHAHSCTHSHRTDQQSKLAKANPIVKNDQFERL